MEEQDSNLNIRHQEEQSIDLQILLKAWTNSVLYQKYHNNVHPITNDDWHLS